MTSEPRGMPTLSMRTVVFYIAKLMFSYIAQPMKQLKDFKHKMTDTRPTTTSSSSSPSSYIIVIIIFHNYKKRPQ